MNRVISRLHNPCGIIITAQARILPIDSAAALPPWGCANSSALGANQGAPAQRRRPSRSTAKVSKPVPIAIDG
jgi:hypothetical protein